MRTWPGHLILGHYKCVVEGAGESTWRRAFAIAEVYGLPLAVVVLSLWRGWQLQSVSALLTAVSILAGGSLSAFTHLSTLRIKLTERANRFQVVDGPERTMMDHAATHLLMSVLTSVVTCAVLVVALATTPDGNLVSINVTAVTNGLVTYLGILFLWSVPRLYNAYVEMNDVSKSLAGNR